jgi:hypothetical protein
MAMRMRQTMDAFEEAFHQETEADRARRERLRKQAAVRARNRRIRHKRKRSSMRFFLLVMVLLGTAAVVTVAMFETLYYVMG